MQTCDQRPARRIALGTVSRSTQGGVRGAIEPFGLYTANVRLD